MKRPGLLWMLQTAAGFSLAAPMLVVGVEFLRGGRYGLGAIVLASGLVALFAPSYVLGRIGGPRAWIRRRWSRHRSGREDDDTGTGAEESNRSVASRLRTAVFWWRR